MSVIIGAVLTLVIGFAVWKFAEAENSPEATPTNPTSGSTPNSAPTPDTATKASAPADTSPAREVRLQRKTGVDVDGAGAKAERADGAAGTMDHYLSEFNLLYANGSRFFEDHGSEQEARARCTKAVADEGSAAGEIFPVMGLQYCFVTSDRRVAWLRVKASTVSTFDSSASAVLAIRVWQS